MTESQIIVIELVIGKESWSGCASNGNACPPPAPKAGANARSQRPKVVTKKRVMGEDRKSEILGK
jgi:hypothetical protein